MQQYDVCRLKYGDVAVILQHDTFNDFKTRIVAPLVPKARRKLATSLNPVLRHDGRDWVLATHLMGVVQTSAIKEVIGSLERENYTIKRALDQLFLGV